MYVFFVTFIGLLHGKELLKLFFTGIWGQGVQSGFLELLSREQKVIIKNLTQGHGPQGLVTIILNRIARPEVQTSM